MTREGAMAITFTPLVDGLYQIMLFDMVCTIFVLLRNFLLIGICFWLGRAHLASAISSLRWYGGALATVGSWW